MIFFVFVILFLSFVFCSFMIIWMDVKKIPWRKEWQPTPGFLPREFHEQRSLPGYSLCGRKESDTTEWLTHTQRYTFVHSYYKLSLTDVSPERLLFQVYIFFPVTFFLFSLCSMFTLYFSPVFMLHPVWFLQSIF